MIDRRLLYQFSLFLGLFLLLIAGMTACQSRPEPLTGVPLSDTVSPAIQSDVDQPEQTSIQNNSDQPATTDPQSEASVATEPPVKASPDPAAIQASWQSSPHANTYVVDDLGQNNTCARCHAPINWIPAMDDLPESCFTCKFEIEDPPPLIPDNEWVNIPCNVCHEVDKKGNIMPEYAWLEIAPLGEYAAVSSSTELCLKCHAPADIPEHGSTVLGGAHADYECTRCHSAHDTTASCSAVDCHPEVIDPATPIPGHDTDHRAVSCVACHDGNGMEIGIDQQTSLWTTFTAGPAVLESFAFTSHNLVLEAPCERCHFVGNPWNLSDSVDEP